MSTGARPPWRDGEEDLAGEPTFADVLNAFSLDSRRTRRRKDTGHENPAPVVARPTESATQMSVAHDEDAVEENASVVRAYAWTGGRTRSDFQLEIETLVTTDERTFQIMGSLRIEHQSVARLCRQSKSVAEVGALLSIPLGVVRVLLGDMARNGWIIVHHTASADDRGPDLELLKRVRNGLARLGSSR